LLSNITNKTDEEKKEL